MNKKTNDKKNGQLNKLSFYELYKLADFMDIGINFNEGEKNIKDMKSEIAFILSTEPESKLNQGLKKLNAN
ncbi:MAG TPA: hypothetical protein VJ208_00830 [Candidatus Nanoarchaeia archaeon]|nr:hypothetical protein [Candidatus Nanoarchaeia archaeon]